jgi:UDP-N-acetylglucosamine 4,6-dehydratase/5-epimerase
VATRVLITGGSGSYGRALITEYKNQYPDTQLFSMTNNENEHWELEKDFGIEGFICDIKEMERVRSVVESIQPDIIIHAAAYKHVPYGERFPDEFDDTNVWGSYVISTVAYDAKVPKCILVSTDKAVNPISHYGDTKQRAEKIFLACDFSVIRFVNFWGSRGSVIPLWLEQKEKLGYITVTDPKMERYFITLEEAAQFTIQCLKAYQPKTVWTPENIKKWKLQDLAQEVCPETPIRIIGNRGYEKLVEELH